MNSSGFKNDLQANNWFKFKLPIVCISILCSKAFLFVGIPLSIWYVWTINKIGKNNKSKNIIPFSKKLAVNYLLLGVGSILDSVVLILFWIGYLIYILFLVDETFGEKKI
ncbi:MAG: hypothetical protein HRT54_08800 [Colwellia sp.]|nr:hypothetical protein [Colwellia sp.]